MTTIDLATILSSVFTGISVFFAIYVYKNKEEKKLFERLRFSLLEDNQKCIELSELLGEPLFTEISHNIVKELKQILPTQYDRETLVKYFTDDSNHDYILQTIHLGVAKTESVRNAKKLIKEIKKIPYEYRDSFPTLYEITGYLNTLIVASCNSVLSSDFYSSIINDAEHFNESIKEIFIKKEHENDPLWEISLLMIASSNAAMEVGTQNILYESLRILDKVVFKFSRFTDSQLKQERKRQNKLLSSITVDRKENYAEELFDFLKQIKIHLNDDEWDEIVESKTRIYDSLKEEYDE